MKKIIYTFAILFLLFSCSSDDSTNDPDNRDPGPFSVTILETYIDGADIEWTEAIDLDDDPVTYSIYVNDELISTGGTALGYTFTGLEPETLYDGYIIADDGRGGESQASFFFETDPEVTIETLDAIYWLFDSFPEAGGTRNIWHMGFVIPVDENAISYQLEVDEIVFETGFPFFEGSVFSWTNEFTDSDYVFYDEEENVFRVVLLVASVNTVNQPTYDETYQKVINISGSAELIIAY